MLKIKGEKKGDGCRGSVPYTGQYSLGHEYKIIFSVGQDFFYHEGKANKNKDAKHQNMQV